MHPQQLVQKISETIILSPEIFPNVKFHFKLRTYISQCQSMSVGHSGNCHSHIALCIDDMVTSLQSKAIHSYKAYKELVFIKIDFSIPVYIHTLHTSLVVHRMEIPIAIFKKLDNTILAFYNVICKSNFSKLLNIVKKISTCNGT